MTKMEAISLPQRRWASEDATAITAGTLFRKSAGEILFIEGDPATHVYQVVSGVISLYKFLVDGRRQIIGFPSRGRFLGYIAGDKYSYSAEAITPVKINCIGRNKFEQMVGQQPEMTQMILAAKLEEIQTAHDQMLLLGRKNAMEKVASFLINQADRQHRSRGPVELPMARSDIADYLGLTLETVSRSLSRLRHDGVIAFPNSAAVQIVGRDHLEELASGDTCY